MGVTVGLLVDGGDCGGVRGLCSGRGSSVRDKISERAGVSPES